MGGEGPVGIGLVINLQKNGSESLARGAELAVEHLNAERDAQRPPFILRRPPADVTGIVHAAAALRDNPSVVGIVGSSDSGGTLDAAGVFADEEHQGANAVVAVSPTATSPALSGRSPWLFRVCPSDAAASRAVARFARDSLAARRAAIIYRNDAFGRDWTKVFSAEFRSGGGTIVERDPYLSEISEWQAYAAYLRHLAPDVILFPGTPSDAERLLAAMKLAGVSVPVIGGDAMSEVRVNPGDPRVRFTAFFLADRATTPEAHAFVQTYRRRYGQPPDQRAALAYDATMVIGRAVHAVGRDRKKVRDYIATYGDTHPALIGATGTIGFDPRNDILRKTVTISEIARTELAR
ncbi:MAG: ABC transporter substrate-binding protein [Gemmatimonadaceae bacterium]